MGLVDISGKLLHNMSSICLYRKIKEFNMLSFNFTPRFVLILISGGMIFPSMRFMKLHSFMCQVHPISFFLKQYISD